MTSTAGNLHVVRCGSSELICRPFVKEAFEHSAYELLWLAASVVGNRMDAETCLADAVRLAEGAAYVAPSWQDLWIKRCVVQAAIERARKEIRAIAFSYPRGCVSYRPSALLSESEKKSLRTYSAEKITDSSNVFECAALMMHGYLGFSTYDCAISIGCHHSTIEPACSNAASRILRERTHPLEGDRPRIFEAIA